MAIIKIGRLQQLGRSEEMHCPELDIKKNKYAKRQVYESFLLSKHFGIPPSHHVSTFPLVFMIQYLILCIAFSFYVCLISKIILCWIRDYALQVFHSHGLHLQWSTIVGFEQNLQTYVGSLHVEVLNHAFMMVFMTQLEHLIDYECLDHMETQISGLEN